MVSAVFKRLLSMPLGPRLTSEIDQGTIYTYGPVIKAILSQVSQEAQRIPIDQRLAPRYTQGTNLDLTAATIFVRNIEVHGK